jgi:hypothetical protein
MPRADFSAAAKRHVADAEFLHAHSRSINADHIAGLAAECALKALIVGHLGGHINQRDFVVHPATGQIKMHIDRLWPEMSIIVQGRSANALTPLLGSNPFHNWTVNERYCDGVHLTGATVSARVSVARTVVQILERAELDGALR